MKKPNPSRRLRATQPARPARRWVTAPVKGVSLRLSDAVGVARDFINELRHFNNRAGRDDRYYGFVPTEVYRMVESFARLAGQSRQDAFGFSVKEGVKLVLLLPDISTIRSCRNAVVLAGSEDIEMFERSTLEVATRSGRRRVWFRKVDPDDVALCAELARELGLDTSTVVALAVMCVLFQVPALPDDKKHDFREEVTRFGLDLQKRAERAELFLDRARAISPPTSTHTFDDVLQDLKKK